ncbi:lysozyme [Empedobacter brevis]|uniref:lysozyme n=1 Tax=Empedobacter brevis TaxID=247 RepID=UPI0023F2694F|nr:lysozyme [Empedobacter brevis]
MNTSNKGLALIKKYEGFYSKPYLDPIGIPTIGYGATYYPNKVKVTMKDKPITEKEASDLLVQMLKVYENQVALLVRKPINQNQFDALVSFTYNLGATNLGKSTLLKKVNKNPNDPTIRDEFIKWNRAGGKVLRGLTNRRKDEAALYFS